MEAPYKHTTEILVTVDYDDGDRLHDVYFDNSVPWGRNMRVKSPA